MKTPSQSIAEGALRHYEDLYGYRGNNHEVFYLNAWEFLMLWKCLPLPRPQRGRSSSGATLEDERLRGRRFPTISSDTFPKDHAAPEPAKHFSNKLERSQFVPVRAMGRKRIPEAPDGAEKLDLRLLSPRTRSLHLNSRIHNVTHEPELCNALS